MLSLFYELLFRDAHWERHSDAETGAETHPDMTCAPHQGITRTTMNRRRVYPYMLGQTARDIYVWCDMQFKTCGSVQALGVSYFI